MGDAAAQPPALLALETSGPVGSVVLAVGDEVVARRFLPETRAHASRLVPAVAEVLEEAGLRPAGVSGVAVGAGPGSFTGVRVAAAAGKGMAHALGVPLWAISSLEAAALSGRVVPAGAGPWADPDGGRAEAPAALGLLFDARGRRLFHAAYRWRDGGLTTLRHPVFLTLDEFLGESDPALALAGHGALRHRDELEARGRTVLHPPWGVATADAVLRRVVIGGVEPLADPWDWEPEYLRDTGAERQLRGPAMG